MSVGCILPVIAISRRILPVARVSKTQGCRRCALATWAHMRNPVGIVVSIRKKFYRRLCRFSPRRRAPRSHAKRSWINYWNRVYGQPFVSGRSAKCLTRKPSRIHSLSQPWTHTHWPPVSLESWTARMLILPRVCRISTTSFSTTSIRNNYF